jgi:hypothetical protein
VAGAARVIVPFEPQAFRDSAASERIVPAVASRARRRPARPGAGRDGERDQRAGCEKRHARSTNACGRRGPQLNCDRSSTQRAGPAGTSGIIEVPARGRRAPRRRAGFWTVAHAVNAPDRGRLGRVLLLMSFAVPVRVTRPSARHLDLAMAVHATVVFERPGERGLEGFVGCRTRRRWSGLDGDARRGGFTMRRRVIRSGCRAGPSTWSRSPQSASEWIACS